MYSLIGLEEEYVKKIYQNTVLYSIHRYQSLPEMFQEFYQIKYQNAQEMKEELEIVEDIEIEEAKEFLIKNKKLIEDMKNQNQPVIDEIADQILAVLKQNLPKEATEIETCQYIFDYVINTMEYATDWLKYCNSIPPIDGYDVMLYKGVPLSTSYKGLLVTRQGVCEDIVNLIIDIGKELGVSIYRENCEHNQNLHAINYIIVNGQKSYLDATSVILKTKTKEEAFLVSQEELNKNQDYTFRTDQESFTLPHPNITYDINQIIKNTDLIMPKIEYILPKQYKK